MTDKKLCLIAAVPSTLWVFYRSLPPLLHRQNWDVDICASEGPELAYFESEYGIKTHRIAFQRRISPWADVVVLFRLVLLFQKNRYDIVHAHTPKAGLLSMIAAFLTRVPHRIYTCHGLPLETEKGFKRSLLSLAEKISCALATQVPAVSQSLREKILHLKLCRSDKVFVLGDGTACGIDLQRFRLSDKVIERREQLKQQFHLQEDDIVLGFVGRMVPDKGIHILIESFIELSRKYENLKLFAIGSFEPDRGSLSDDILQFMKNCPSVIQVDFTQEIECYYALMNILVLPTRREGFGLVLLEAGALNVPVIATSVTGCVDAVIHNETGILIEKDDAKALTRAVIDLIENTDFRQKITQNAQKRIKNLFSQQRLLQKHVNLYDSFK